MPINLQGSSVKLMCNDHKIAKLYCENNVIYSSGNTVTYHVDAGITYQEEVDKGASCLSPKTFTPAKAGWQFVGWRADTTATSNAYRDPYIPLIMGDDPISLYAVFAQDVTVTYYNNSTAAAKTSTSRYYNNGNIVNPSFTLTQTARSGWTARGWSTGTAGNSEITYANGAAFTRDSNITLYGMYQQTITVTYYNAGTSASVTSGTRYYNSGSGNVVNPTFTLTQTVLPGWTARGWSTSTAGNGGISYNNGAAFTRDSNITLYGLYYQTITLTYYNGSTSAASTSGTRYYNPGSSGIIDPTFTLTPASLSGWTFRGWATSSAAAAGIAYGSISGTAFAASTTVYAAYHRTITLSYSGNGATGGSTAAQTGTQYWNTGNISNPTFTLAANGFARSGYTFSKWALGSAGGTQYAAGASITLSESNTMYAVWISAGYYAVKDGTIVAAPSANAWVSGHSTSTGTVNGRMGVYYGARGHTSGANQTWGATTGNLLTNGCAYIAITVMDSTWGSGVPYANVKVIGITPSGAQTTITSYTPRYSNPTAEGGAYSQTLDVSAYTYIAVTIEVTSYSSTDAWVEVGFTDVQFY